MNIGFPRWVLWNCVLVWKVSCVRNFLPNIFNVLHIACDLCWNASFYTLITPVNVWMKVIGKREVGKEAGYFIYFLYIYIYFFFSEFHPTAASSPNLKEYSWVSFVFIISTTFLPIQFRHLRHLLASLCNCSLQCFTPVMRAYWVGWWKGEFWYFLLLTEVQRHGGILPSM